MPHFSVISLAPESPCSLSHTEKERQLSLSSFILSAALVVSWHPLLPAPMAARMETFLIPPSQLRFC